MKGNKNMIGKSDRIGNSDSIGNSDRIGNSDSIGKSDRIGSNYFDFRKLHGRREFFDAVKDYIIANPNVELTQLDAYFQYTTGASEMLIRQALAVLENVGLIESIEYFKNGYRLITFKIKSNSGIK